MARRGLVALAIVVLMPAMASAAQGVLLDRTLAIVGGEAITLADVQTARALELIDERDTAAATERLITRTLMLREVERYAPAEPAPAAVDTRVAELAARLPGDRLAQVLEAGGFTDARLRAWIRNDLRIAAYLAQRFAAVGTPSEEEVSTYYRAHREEFDRRAQTFEQAAPEIRERLAVERRQNLIADWVADLRRRTPVIELWKR